jgi:hypothetical protein
MGREVVDLEVNLAKTVSKRKEVGLENDSLAMKLDKLTNMSESKIEEMTQKLIKTDDEIFENKAYYQEYSYTMEHEKDRILDETQSEFESSLRPMQNQYNANQIEIEEAKDMLRRMKLKFEALKEDIVRDVEVVESRTLDETTFVQN